MQKLDEEEARQAERQKVFSHVLLPSFILAVTVLLVLFLLYAI